MPIERMSVPGLDAIMGNPGVVGGIDTASPYPPVLKPVVMQQGGLVGDAATLQNAGRGGDNMLVHMNPEEVGALNQLGQFGIGDLRRSRMTINPQTGLPEMFSFRDLLPTIAGIAATAMGGGALVAALAASGTSLATQDPETRDLGRALMAGVGAYAGASLASTVGGAGAASQIPAGEAGSLAMMGQSAVDPSQALLTQASLPDPTQFAAAQAAETGMFAAPVPYEGIGTAAPVDMGIGLDYGGYNLPTTYADGITPISPEFTDLAYSDPEALGAALRSPGGTTPFSQQDVARNLGRETWQSNAGSNIWEGMGKISPLEWKASKAGELGLRDIAKPALMSAVGTAGSMPPPVWEPPPPRRSYAYDASGMPDRTFDLEASPEDYVPGKDPEWEYFKDTTPSYLSKHGYRGRGDLPTVNAASGYSRLKTRLGEIPDFPDRWSRAMPMMSLVGDWAKETAGGIADLIPFLAKDEEEEIPASAEPMPVTREEEEERLQRISNYYQPGNWKPMRRDRYAFPAQAGTEGLVVEEAALQQLPPEEAATTGIMDVAPPAAQDAVEDRMAVTPSPDQPQNPEERAIFDQALLALQGVLEPDAAEEAIDVFIETFGMDAYSELIALVENKLDEGGIVKPANGGTTVAMGDVQGPDMIPGNIVDPMTGERTANLNVGENEYIEPAPSLARRAMAAGMPPTPENGALVRGAEEDQLKAMYG